MACILKMTYFYSNVAVSNTLQNITSHKVPYQNRKIRTQWRLNVNAQKEMALVKIIQQIKGKKSYVRLKKKLCTTCRKLNHMAIYKKFT